MRKRRATKKDVWGPPVAFDGLLGRLRGKRQTKFGNNRGITNVSCAAVVTLGRKLAKSSVCFRQACVT